jgi:hypothetical protein
LVVIVETKKFAGFVISRVCKLLGAYRCL